VAKSWNRTETWLALIVLAVGLLPIALLGLYGYMSATATPLHPIAVEVPSVIRPAPAARWAAAVKGGRQAVRAALAEQNVPGLSVAVGVGGGIVWAEGFGWADLENRVPVTPETRFRIGTASTVLTSAAAGLLLENGRLKLEDEIQSYVPEFPRKEWRVTLHHLMAHLGGVRNDGGDEGPLFSRRCERPVEALRAFADRSLLFEPGTQFRYSSYGWILVSAAVEAAAGEPFLEFMQKRVFEPLRMDGTGPENIEVEIPDRATFYFPRFASDPRYGLHLMRRIDYSCYAGSSVFLSTPSDLVRFGLAIESGSLLQPSTVRLLQTPQRLASGEETGYGLGWDLETVSLAGEQARAAGHDGESLGGRVASLVTFPGRGIVVSVTSNISYTDTFAVASRLAQAFAEAAGRPAPVPPPVANRAARAVDEDHHSTLSDSRSSRPMRILEGTAYAEVPKLDERSCSTVSAFSTLNTSAEPRYDTRPKRKRFATPSASRFVAGSVRSVPAGARGTVSDGSTMPGMTGSPGVHGRPAQSSAVYRVPGVMSQSIGCTSSIRRKSLFGRPGTLVKLPVTCRLPGSG
jgi:CubicO group peptidase (beta-lactamase class C family)